MRTLTVGRHTVRALAFRPDGAALAVGNSDATLVEWATGRRIPLLPPAECFPAALAFAFDRGVLIAQLANNIIAAWDAESGASRHFVRPALGGPCLVAGSSPAILFWGEARVDPLRVVYMMSRESDGRPVGTIPHGYWNLTLTAGRGDVALWSIRIPEAAGYAPDEPEPADGPNGPLWVPKVWVRFPGAWRTATPLPDGRWLGADQAGRTAVWPPGFAPSAGVTLPFAPVTALAVSPDGALATAGGRHGTVAVWDLG